MNIPANPILWHAIEAEPSVKITFCSVSLWDSFQQKPGLDSGYPFSGEEPVILGQEIEQIPVHESLSV